MDNISELLGSVLSNPDSMEKIRETARQLGLDTSDGTDNKHEPAKNTDRSGADPLSALIPAAGKLTPLLGKLNEEDDMTRLLHALKPYLSGARLKRAEEADRIISVMRIIPLLKNPHVKEQES